MCVPNVNGTVNLTHGKSESSEVVKEYLRDEKFHLENILEMLFVPLNVYLIKPGETIYLNYKNYESLQKLIISAFANNW